jgi:hypothetical protein
MLFLQLQLLAAACTILSTTVLASVGAAERTCTHAAKGVGLRAR